MSLTNLLSETIEDLKNNGKTPEDVLWVGNRDFYTDWNHFSKVANKEYYSGFGTQEVASDLLVVGEGWYMERYEYDGSECWTFHQAPSKPKKRLDFKKVVCGMCDSLEDMNEKMIKNMSR